MSKIQAILLHVSGARAPKRAGQGAAARAMAEKRHSYVNMGPGGEGLVAQPAAAVAGYVEMGPPQRQRQSSDPTRVDLR